MWELLHRSIQRFRMLTLKQVCVESLVCAVWGGIVSFYYNHSLWHAAGTAGTEFLLF